MEQIDKKLLSWASILEPEAQEQAARTSRLPFIDGHVALMPDAHFGMGSTVGSVIPTRGAVIPAAVGVDIGCGMIALNTLLTSKDLPEDLSSLMPLFEDRIPAGLGKGRIKDGYRDNMIDMGKKLTLSSSFIFMDQKLRATSRAQMGSLGSGNHFVEVCLDEEDTVWIVLHSGSRGVGNKLAGQHIKVAKGLMKEYFITLEDPDLAYLVAGTPEFEAYIADMLWSQDYALANREAMMDEAVKSLFEVVGLDMTWPEKKMERINCHHNFTQQENIGGGRNVWLTRKGAISARHNERGVIPGSMGTSSYITAGLGNPASYFSCSHGAGRVMSRSRAHRELTLESLDAAMEGKVWNRNKGAALIDESPAAYKDIDQVMEDQKDLVTIVHTLHQIVNYKGT
jgi:tRNA-splicing ligase RtcB